MKNLYKLDQYREREAELAYYGCNGDSTCGMFTIRGLRIIAATGGGWDHVSVSHRERIPRWHEMSYIHSLFFEENELTWQYHMPVADHINCHPHTLHIWRKWNFDMPVPPKEFVA